MSILGRAFKVSRTTIYAWQNQEFDMTRDYFVIKDLVSQVRKYMPRIGSHKLYHILKLDLESEGVNIGRDKFHNVLKTLCLLVPRKKKFFRTTDSNHLFNKHSNRVKGMKLDKPEELWVSDITYLKTSTGSFKTVQ